MGKEEEDSRNSTYRVMTSFGTSGGVCVSKLRLDIAEVRVVGCGYSHVVRCLTCLVRTALDIWTPTSPCHARLCWWMNRVLGAVLGWNTRVGLCFCWAHSLAPRVPLSFVLIVLF